MGMLAASPVVSRGFRIARSVAWHGVLLHVAVAWLMDALRVMRREGSEMSNEEC